jgi:hypothetical protein
MESRESGRLAPRHGWVQPLALVRRPANRLIFLQDTAATGIRTVTSTAHATREKFLNATRILASHTGPMKARLREALVPDLLTLTPEDMPWPDLWERFITIREEIAPHQKTDVLLERWWDFELGRIALEIVDLYDEMSRRA